MFETSRSLPGGRSPAQRVQKSKKGKKAVQKGEKQGKTSGVLFIKEPTITFNKHEVKLLKRMLVALAELILLFNIKI